MLFKLSQGYYLLPKGVFMPLLNCGSPSAGLPLHWYWATTNYQLITSGKNGSKCASFSLVWGDNQTAHRFMRQDTSGLPCYWGARQSSLHHLTHIFCRLQIIFLMADCAGNKVTLFIWNLDPQWSRHWLALETLPSVTWHWSTQFNTNFWGIWLFGCL